MNRNAWYWHFLENYIYYIPSPPPRTRTKPMEVICVGFPRSGTESLQQALLKLGYDYTYHGWDILFDDPQHIDLPGWARLGKRKFWPSKPEHDSPIPVEEFDRLVGHAVALTDAPGSCFASDLIQAYPEAKVVLNYRKDEEAWQRSALKNLVGVDENWLFRVLHWFDAEMWWMWHVYERTLWYGLFRCTDGTLRSGIEGKGRQIMREQGDMVRGMMKRLGRERELLEWDVGNGWESLCEFLGKNVPRDEKGNVLPFPRVNDRAGFQEREKQALAVQGRRAVTNMLLVVGAIGAVVYGVCWRVM